MTLKQAYQRLTPTEILHLFLNTTWSYWRALESAEVAAFFGVLLSFIRSDFNDETIDVPVEVAKVWARSKTRICTRYMEPEAQEEPS